MCSKYQDFKYVRPDIDKLNEDAGAIIQQFENSKSVEEQNELIIKFNKISSLVRTMLTLVSTRYSLNTNDEFYAKENEFFDATLPQLQGIMTKFTAAFLRSPFRRELEEKWGKQIFTLGELEEKVFDPKIIEDLQEENRLITEYRKLEASARIMFKGEERNTSQMTPFKEDMDRETRKAAWEAYAKFFSDNEDKFDEIYGDLVKVRTSMAKKLGYENYVQFGYDRMNRSDYNADMVANYRKQVKESLVPYAAELYERQRNRLGYDKLYYYDQSLVFNSGNATPKGDPDWILNKGKQMYEELSPETGEFINMMMDRNLLDVIARKGKMGGGYCTIFPDYKVPFIFANFNGTSGDVDVLTHEAGHAFQGWKSMDFELLSYIFPTYEACEIHSMSMEFFTWPWMNLFFEEDTEKYKFMHLSEAITFVPYGVTVDEFQHWVYEHPEATAAERKAAWREIEKKYQPWKDYGDNEFYAEGGFWSNKQHIFTTPFYYIDYTLAQICALQFWRRSRENREDAWSDYLTLCSAGGSLSFVGLVELANLDNPFVDGCIRDVIKPIKAYLDNVDDTKL